MRKLLFLIIFILFSLAKSSQGGRILHSGGDDKRDQILFMVKNLIIQSLPRGPVPPSGPNPCTNLPGMGGSGCPPLNEMNFAGTSLGHTDNNGGGTASSSNTKEGESLKS